MSAISLFLLLLSVHALCDYPLQGDFLARGKSHKAPIPGVPFYHPLFAHAAIHGGAVGIVTQSVTLGLFEFACHAVIDYLKCDGKTSLDTDQVLHVVCKAVWVLLLTTITV
jgi:hypothetical protein